MQHLDISEFSLRIYLQGMQLAAIEYLMVEFGFAVSTVIVDAVRLHSFLEEEHRCGLAVWASWRNALLGTSIKYAETNFYVWHNFMWKMLCEVTSEPHSDAQELILTQFSRREIKEWSGVLGERFERNPTQELRRMLGTLYSFYLEYQRGGYVNAFIVGKNGEPTLVDVREYLNLSDTRP